MGCFEKKKDCLPTPWFADFPKIVPGAPEARNCNFEFLVLVQEHIATGNLKRALDWPCPQQALGQ